jgi:hypothetical protein
VGNVNFSTKYAPPVQSINSSQPWPMHFSQFFQKYTYTVHFVAHVSAKSS